MGHDFEVIALLVSLMLYDSQAGATERTCSAEWTSATKPGHMKCELPTGLCVSHSLAAQQRACLR